MGKLVRNQNPTYYASAIRNYHKLGEAASEKKIRIYNLSYVRPSTRPSGRAIPK